MKTIKGTKCPGCGKNIQVTKQRKYAPHNNASHVRCSWSGSRVIIEEKNK